MNLLRLTFFLLMSAWLPSSLASNIDIPADPAQGVSNPVSLSLDAGQNEDGTTFLAAGADIWQGIMESANTLKQNLDSHWFEWSYNRGLGSLPNSCPADSMAVGGACVQSCPTGFNLVAGVCWQECPADFKDGGAVCTNWKTLKTVGKQNIIPARSAMSCAAGSVNEAGLCYEPCAAGFSGVGPFCFGQMDSAANAERMTEQVAAQHETALASAPAGGIALTADAAPKLRTHIIFTPIVCSMDAIDGAFGVLPNPAAVGAMAVDAAGDAVVKAISDGVSQGGGASFIPTVADTVLFDYTADTACADDGVVSSASMSFNPSVTVKISSSLFDPVLHNLAGVDLGIMRMSIYELIPFRIYGTVGTTLGAPVELTSKIDRRLPPLLVDNQPFATSTSLLASPSMDLWLSTDAQVRVTSFLSFIPDLLQLGAEFKLHVLDNQMPYQLSEGLRAGDQGYELFRTEQLDNELRAGHGYVNSYLRVLGINIDAFGDKARIDWSGHQQQDRLFERSSAVPVSL